MGNRSPATDIAKANQESTVSVGGKNLINEATIFKGALLWCMGEAERIKGSAPNTPEIGVVYH